MNQKQMRFLLEITFPEGDTVEEDISPVNHLDAAEWLNQLKLRFPGLTAAVSSFKPKPVPAPKNPRVKRSVSSPKQPLKNSFPMPTASDANGFEQLTERQKDIVNLLFKGCSYLEISKNLGISLPTVRAHLHSAYKRLQVRSRAQAVAKIFRQGSVNL
jgi:DNA-binding CsgD family transcriptional regulator